MNEDNHKKIKHISVFGFADANREDPLYREAYEASQILAQNGYTIINGGGPGVMRASTEGARAVGGRTIGVTFYPKDVARFEGRDPENTVDEEVVCKSYLDRTLKLLELGDAYLIFKGGTGTISEFGMAWGLARLYFGHHKPLLLYGDFWNDVVASFISNMRMRPEELRVYRVVGSSAEVLEAIRLFDDMRGQEDKKFSEDEKAFQL